jgi:hypothetical protein
MWQEYKVQFDPTVTLYPTYTLAFMPVGRLAAVCTTELSPIDEKFITLKRFNYFSTYSTLLISPRMTLLYQTDAHLFMSTSPTTQRRLYYPCKLTEGGIGCDPGIFCAWL